MLLAFMVHALQERISEDVDDGRAVVAIRSSQFKDPLCLVATMAHELGHVILLGRGLMSPQTSDHEPMTDLLTVYLGFGVFNANAANRFKQFQDERRQGWSIQRLGYLTEEIFGYALAKFSVERGEGRVEWQRHLSTNVRSLLQPVPALAGEESLRHNDGKADRLDYSAPAPE